MNCKIAIQNPKDGFKKKRVNLITHGSKVNDGIE